MKRGEITEGVAVYSFPSDIAPMWAEPGSRTEYDDPSQRSVTAQLRIRPIMNKYLTAADFASAGGAIKGETDGSANARGVFDNAAAIADDKADTEGGGQQHGPSIDYGVQTDLQTIKRSNDKADGDWQINLYLPQGIPFRGEVSYQSIDLGVLGATAANAIAAGSSIKDTGTKLIKEEGGRIIDSLLGSLTGEAASLAALRLANKAGSEIGGIVASATGVQTNPNSRTLFQSVPIRGFTFNFKMIPESEREHKTIVKIIQLLREEMYPDEIGIDELAVGYRFPNRVEVEMLHVNDSKRPEADGLLEDPHVIYHKLLPCYIRDCSVVYNSQGMGYHPGGKFTDVDMSITLMEERPLNKSDIKDNY